MPAAPERGITPDKGYIPEYLRHPDLRESFGEITARCYDADLKKPRILHTTFVTPPEVALVGEDHISASDDAMVVPMLKQGEYGVVPKMMPGVENYYRKTGLLRPGSRLLQVTYPSTVRWQWPDMDPVYQALQYQRSGEQVLPQNAYLISSFPHRQEWEMARESGVDTLQRYDHAFASDKAQLHIGSEQFGFPMAAPWKKIQTIDGLRTTWEQMRQVTDATWVKLLRSSGGDGVKKIRDIQNLSWEDFLQKFLIVRNTFFDTVQKATRGQEGGNRYWDPENLTPDEGLLMEADASVHGRPLPSESNILEISRDGNVYETGRFRQLLKDGNFLGSVFIHDQRKKVTPDSVMGKVGAYYQSINTYGVVCMDTVPFADESEDIIEGNVRPSVSFAAREAYRNVAQTLATAGVDMRKAMFAHTSDDIPTGVHTLADVKAYAGKYWYDGDPKNWNGNEGRIVPWAVGGHQIGKDVIPGTFFRYLVIANSEEQCEKVIQNVHT